MVEGKHSELMKLKGRIIAEGLTQEEVAKNIGISYSSFRNKMKRKTSFTLDEIYNIVEFLNIEEDEIITYFFGNIMRNAV